MSPQHRSLAVAAVVAGGVASLAALLVAPAAALEPPATVEEAPPTDAAREGAAAPDGDRAELAPACDVPTAGDEPWLDDVRRGVFEGICQTAQWFDGFFGNRRFHEEAQRTNGRAHVQIVWDEYESLEVDGRLRVRVDLPNLDERVNAFFGRDDQEDFVSGVDDEINLLPDFFRREGEEEWLIGLGYRPVGNARHRTDFDVGVDVDFPLEPFVRGRYRQFWLAGDRNLVRYQQSLYWRNQHGTGTSTRLDVERPVGRRTLLRWSGRGTIDEATEGVDWASGITAYQALGTDHAIAVFFGADGETDDAVKIHEYGTRVTYRRRMLREWFFGELIGGVTWPREEPGEIRQAAWHFGFGFEIQFSGAELGAGRLAPASAPLPGDSR